MGQLYVFAYKYKKKLVRTHYFPHLFGFCNQHIFTLICNLFSRVMNCFFPLFFCLDFLTFFFFSSYSNLNTFCNLIWPSWACLGVKGARVTFLSLSTKEYLLNTPSKEILLSNCHGYLSMMWLACNSSTSHNASSSYRPILEEIRTCLVTRTLPLLLSHCSLYGRRWSVIDNFNLSTMRALATLVQLSPSMIKLHSLFFTRYRI